MKKSASWGYQIQWSLIAMQTGKVFFMLCILMQSEEKTSNRILDPTELKLEKLNIPQTGQVKNYSMNWQMAHQNLEVTWFWLQLWHLEFDCNNIYRIIHIGLPI